MSVPRTSCRLPVVLVLAVLFGTGCTRLESDAALRVVLQLSPHLKANCVQLSVTGGGLQDETEVGDPGTQTSLVYAVYRGAFPKTVTLVGKGYVGPSGCQGELLLNEETAPLEATFDVSRIGQVILTLDTAVVPYDADNDGFRSAEADGPDCDDQLPKINPSSNEDCADGKDNNCNGLIDCADPTCPNRACATGTCQGTVCVNGPVELDCANGIDDDKDGAVDCADFNCEARTCAKDRCTTGVCSSYACQGATPVTCEPLSECHGAGVCTLAEGCTYAVVLNQSCNGGQGACDQNGVCQNVFPYSPSNFTPRPLLEHSDKVVLDCGGAGDVFIYDSTPGAANDGFEWWCPTTVRPAVSRVTLPNGLPAVVLSMRGLEVKKPWRIVGSQPVILSVIGDAEIHRMIDAGGDETRPGPNGGLSTYCGQGGTGGVANQDAPGGGGGGAGLTTAGGSGGGAWPSGSAPGFPGTAEAATGPHVLIPRGGCNGGKGGNAQTTEEPGGRGGLGGGGLQISASGWIRVLRVSSDFPGTVTTSGAGGEGGRPPSGRNGTPGGGGGGGSGGSILLEANDLYVSGRITANGGGGGEGASKDSSNFGTSGRRNFESASPAQGGSGSSDTSGNGGAGGAWNSSPTTGQPGLSDSGAGGGGGGATGKINLRIRLGCGMAKFASGAVVSPPPTGCTF